jgi:hypothetical protein
MTERGTAMSAELIVFTPTEIAKRWKCSRDKAVRIVKPYVGQGVIDLGSKENVRRRKRSYSILRVPLSVLQKIEQDLTG